MLDDTESSEQKNAWPMDNWPIFEQNKTMRIGDSNFEQPQMTKGHRLLNQQYTRESHSYLRPQSKHVLLDKVRRNNDIVNLASVFMELSWR